MEEIAIKKLTKKAKIGILIYIVIHLVAAIIISVFNQTYVGNVGWFSIINFYLAVIVIRKMINKGTLHENNAISLGFFIALVIRWIIVGISTLIMYMIIDSF